MDLLAAAEAASHPSCLELGTPGRRVGREVTRHSEQNSVTLLAAPPVLVGADAGLQHLIGMKIRILAQHRLGEGLDQRTGGMAKGEIAGCYASRRRNLVLAVECRQKCVAEVFRIRRQIIQVRR